MAAIRDGLGSTLLVTEVRAGLRDWDSRSIAYPGSTLVVSDLHPLVDSPDCVPDQDYSPGNVARPNSQTILT